MNKDLLPEDGDQDGIIIHAAEEAAELIAELALTQKLLSKIKRFGPNGKLPGGALTNKQQLAHRLNMLYGELEDFEKALDRVFKL